MSGAPRPRSGPGRFQWNSGGWFGSQVGATAWLVPFGIWVWSLAGEMGAAPLAACALANAWGILLWRRRGRLAPYPAVQALLAGVGLLAAGSVLVVDLGTRGPGAAAELRSMLDSLYWALLLVPAIMLGFHLAERAARAAP